MNWNVTYRAKDGKQTVDAFEAESRETLFKVLTAKGISPIRIEQSDKAHRPTKGVKAAKTGAAKIVCWIILCIIAAGCAFVLIKHLGHKDPVQTQQLKKKKPPKSETPQHPVSKPSPATPPEPPKRVLTPEERRAGLEAVRNREYEGPVLDMDTYVSPDPGFSNRWERFKAEQAKLPFKYMSENEIAVILHTKPGDMVLDTISHPNFERDFLKSLEEPIIPLPTDDEKTAQLKRDMVQAKIVLKRAYDNGESITDILRNERAELIKIHGLRENLFRELKEIEKNAKSSKEIDDFVSAANVMLDEYGAKHIKLPYSRERMKLERAEGLIP